VIPKTDPLAWLLEGLLAQSRQPVWRSIERWRRRDSILLVGLLGSIEFLLITGIVVGRPGIVVVLGVGSLAAPLGALVLAEAAIALSPTQRRRARADHLVLVTVGIFFALGLVGAMATAIGGLG
jgi:hypothetical protein